MSPYFLVFRPHDQTRDQDAGPIVNYGIRPLPTLLLAIALTGCTAFNYNEPDSPVPQLSVAPLAPEPSVALVLGSGGPRGYAHIGVMEVLEGAGLEIDLVVGSSVGSLIGAFWAYGYNAAELDVIAGSGGPLALFDFSPFCRPWLDSWAALAELCER